MSQRLKQILFNRGLEVVHLTVSLLLLGLFSHSDYAQCVWEEKIQHTEAETFPDNIFKCIFLNENI